MKTRGIVAAAALSLAWGTAVADRDLRETARALFGVVSAASPEELADPRAELGRSLFWDARLSADGRTACASCHFAAAWGADERARSVNARGARTLNAQTVFNAQEVTAGLRWVGDRPTGALQAIGSVTGSMGFTKADDIVEVLVRHGYGPWFERVFPGTPEAVGVDHYGSALEAYQRTLRTPSVFDRWMAGDDAALSPVHKRGLERFVATGCAGCHGGALFGGGSRQRFGITQDYWLQTGSADIDPGRSKVTGRSADRYVFRVAPLRNVAKTPPYFHDGSVASLANAIRVMAKVQLGRSLDDEDVGAIEAFLGTLTGEVPDHFAPPPPGALPLP